MTSRLSNKHDAALVEGCVCCVELLVLCTAFGYRTILKRDGTILERKNFTTEEQVLSWANAIMDLIGQSLYVKLYSQGGHRGQAALLELAPALARRGAFVGSNNLCCICRLPSEHLE